jgi:crotonobetainyl-CoA:carnitine CoA-transferase CaiB-like acyl-CoA transferase
MAARALEGLRVIQVDGGVAAGYATKLLADLGADTILVEPPDGDETRRYGPFPGNEPHPEKSGLFLYLNCNKRGVTLDLTTDNGRAALHQLLRNADLLMHTTPPAEMAARGLDWETVHALNPALVECSISRFGQTGPDRDYKGYELTSASAGGWATITGAGPEGADLPPLKAFGQQADFQAGLNAAVASLGALLARDLQGAQGQHIDLSIQEVVLTILEMAIVHYSYGKRVASRLGGRIVQPWAILPAKDGLVFVLCVQNAEWDRFVEWMGNPEWASWEIFDDRLKRAETWDVLRPYIEEWTSRHTVEEIYTGGLERKLAFAPLSTMGDLLRNEHLRVRGFFATIGHPEAGELEYPGAPWKLGATPWELRTPAPLLGEHNEEIVGNGQWVVAAVGNGQSAVGL